MVNHNHAIAIAVEGNTEIRFFSQHTSLERANVGSPHFGIDVYTVWLTTDSDNVRPQFAQHVRRDVISRTVCTIHHNLQFTEAKFVRERGFAKLDIATRGINDTAGFTQFCRINAADLLFHFRFDGLFYRIRQFGAVDREEFNAIIVERVMRCRYHNSGLCAEGTRQISHGRCWHRTSEECGKARSRQTRFQC